METMEFWLSEEFKGAYPEPIPASLALPQWIKDDPNSIEGRMGEGDGVPHTNTYKRCVPFMDLMRTGYIIPLWSDVAFSYSDACTMEHPTGEECDIGPTVCIEFPLLRQGAPIVQDRDWDTWGSIPELSDSIPGGAFTFCSPWIIKTPPGYSTLITAPFNDTARPHPSIKTLSAIVNTDTYTNPITFFFHIKEGFNEVLKRGTPLVQVIPIKREEWNHKIIYMKKGDDYDIAFKQELSYMGTKFTDGYRDAHGCPVIFH